MTLTYCKLYEGDYNIGFAGIKMENSSKDCV